MATISTVAPGRAALAREKRDLQKAQLRPLANRRPELYEEDEYTSEEYEQKLQALLRRSLRHPYRLRRGKSGLHRAA